MVKWLACGAAGGLAVLVSLGCGSHPVPLVARAGSNFSMAVIGELGSGEGSDPDGDIVGFGSTAYWDEGLADVQRGELEFKLEDVSTGAQYPLETQLVVRTHPDPGSRAGIENGIIPDELGPQSNFDLGTAQVLAILFIPEATPDSEYYIRARRVLRAFAGDPSPQVLGPLSLEDDDIVIEVLPADPEDERTPLEAFFKNDGVPHDSSGDLTKLFPYPKVLLNLPGGAPAEPNLPVPSAADIVLEYPEHIEIKDVFEEQHLGRESLISWQDFPGVGDGGGLLRIRFVSMEHDPKAVVKQIAIAFEPDPVNYTRIGQTEVDAYFEIEEEVFGVETAYYDADGNELDFTGSAAPPWLGPIR